MATKLESNVALVTGGASGLGRAIADRLGAEGFRVVITDVDVELGEQVAARCGYTFFQHDVRDEDQWNAVVRQAESGVGPLTVLVNNAGILGSMDAPDPENARLEDWRKLFSVNVEGVFLGCKAIIPALRRSGSGSIINMSSVAGLVASPYATAYGATKATVRQMTKSVAQYCAEQKLAVRCNSVHPGNVMTPLWLEQAEEMAAARGITADEMVKLAKANVPLGDFPTPEDVAAAVSFLASSDSRYITGTMLIVDGGRFECNTYRPG